jgi:predicted phage-related endonuclease
VPRDLSPFLSTIAFACGRSASVTTCWISNLADIGQEFTDQTGLHIAGEQMELTHPDYPWAVGRADGLVFDGHVEEATIDLALGGIEIKSSREWKAHDHLPVEWQAQANHYLWLSGLERWWFAVGYSGWHVQVYVHERNDDVVQWQAEREIRFYEEYVLPRIPPPVSGDDLDAIGDVYPDVEPAKTADLHPELVEQWQLAKEAEDIAVLLRKDYEAQIRERARDAEVLTVAGLPWATLRQQSRKGSIDEAAVSAAGIDLEPFRKPPSTFRVLRPKKETA